MNSSTIQKIIMVLQLFIALQCNVVYAGSVTSPGNKHNLSSSGHGIPGVTRAIETEERVCIYCHTPHHANTKDMKNAPLWSRNLSNKTYDLYASSTLTSSPQQPSGSSRLCLSCHDGTIALGMLSGGKILGGLSSPLQNRPSNLGGGGVRPDLSNDHPISVLYPLNHPELANTAALPIEVRLDDGMVQCTSCHDPHNDRNPYFQVKDNKQPGSPLCVSCHTKDAWSTSSHASLNIYYPSVPPKSGGEVFACEACHATHNAQLAQGLLRGTSEKMTCLLTCHNGALPKDKYGQRVDIAFSKAYKHTVGEAVGVHQGDEDTIKGTQTSLHVECADCHNPHRVNKHTATAPFVSGRLEGVKVEKLATHDFRLAETEYDVCFKCHSESYNLFKSNGDLPVRLYSNSNMRELFNPGNYSSHPVIHSVGAANVTGLKSSYIGRNSEIIPLDSTSKIYCVACHDPHGSNQPHMLVDTYLQDVYPSSYFSSDYGLCYRCHDETKLLDGVSSSFRAHKTHVKNPDNLPEHVNKIPCSVCHDPHGVPGSRYLINFDTRSGFVSAVAPVPVFKFVDLVKSCTVSCHSTGLSTGDRDKWTHSYRSY